MPSGETGGGWGVHGWVFLLLLCCFAVKCSGESDKVIDAPLLGLDAHRHMKRSEIILLASLSTAGTLLRKLRVL